MSRPSDPRSRYVDAIATSLSTMSTEQRLEFWKQLESDFASAFTQAKPSASPAALEEAWLLMAQEIAERLAALENRARPR